MAPTVSCRGGLMELRQPSRKVMQLSQQLFVSQKTQNKINTNQHKSTQTMPPTRPPEMGTWQGTCKAGSRVASGPHGPLQPIPALSCLYTQWAHPQPRLQGMAWAGDPGQPSIVLSPSLALLWQPRVLKANSTPHNQLLILQLDKVIQNQAHSKESFTFRYSS